MQLGCTSVATTYVILLLHSLVPMPFPRPVFDRLQYANMEGEGLGVLVTCDDVKQTEGRLTGGSAQQRVLKPKTVVHVCTLILL